jgi:hypothetical protein
VIRLSGSWRLRDGLPSINAVKTEIESSPYPKLVLFDTQELADWDSSIVWFLTTASERCRERGIAVDRDKLPKGLCRLVELAEAVSEKKGSRSEFVAMPFLERVGNTATFAFSTAFTDQVRPAAPSHRPSVASIIASDSGAPRITIVLIAFAPL